MMLVGRDRAKNYESGLDNAAISAHLRLQTGRWAVHLENVSLILTQKQHVARTHGGGSQPRTRPRLFLTIQIRCGLVRIHLVKGIPAGVWGEAGSDRRMAKTVSKPSIWALAKSMQAAIGDRKFPF